MISVQSVTKAFGPKKLFEDVDVSFAPGNRYGLTGPNGAGKTTFMKIIAGDEEADTGQILRPKKLGILRQDQFRFEDNRVVDVVLMGNRTLWDAMSEKEGLLAKPEINDEDAWDRLWHSDVHDRWGKIMDPLMEFGPDGVVASSELREVFHLRPAERGD